MSTKLVAVGNVLMGDDGIAIFLAGRLEADMLALGIEVIYGETDIGYCLTQIHNGDYLIVLDGACLGKSPGEVSVLPLHTTQEAAGMTQHYLRFTDLLPIYYPEPEGMLLAVEISDTGFRYGISEVLADRADGITNEILHIVRSIEAKHKGADL